MNRFEFHYQMMEDSEKYAQSNYYTKTSKNK